MVTVTDFCPAQNAASVTILLISILSLRLTLLVGQLPQDLVVMDMRESGKGCVALPLKPAFCTCAMTWVNAGQVIA
jgi:hypothetical protein